MSSSVRNFSNKPGVSFAGTVDVLTWRRIYTGGVTTVRFERHCRHTCASSFCDLYPSLEKDMVFRVCCSVRKKNCYLGAARKKIGGDMCPVVHLNQRTDVTKLVKFWLPSKGNILLLRTF